MDADSELFGAWTTGTATVDLAAGSAEVSACWRREIPADARAARADWQAQAAALRRDCAGIEQAVERLDRFIEAWAPGELPQPKSLLSEPALPEAALAEALREIDAPRAKALLDRPQAIAAELDAFFWRVRELTSSYAVIETSAGGLTIARTFVGWTGDFRSLWRRDATTDQVGLHWQNVQLALTRRALLIRMVGVIVTGAAKIALRLAVPGAQLLVLPAIWQFIRDVMAEYRRARAEGVS